MSVAPRLCVLTFATTSHVYQAERTLGAAGLTIGLRPVPQGVPSRCGVCLQGELAMLDAYRAILIDNLRPVGVYERLTDSAPWTLVAPAEVSSAHG